MRAGDESCRSLFRFEKERYASIAVSQPHSAGDYSRPVEQRPNLGSACWIKVLTNAGGPTHGKNPRGR
jgi:hypothetical protein